MRFAIVATVFGVLLSAVCVRPALADIYRTIHGFDFVSCGTSVSGEVAF
jgi:hypothetical protein